MLNEIAQNWLVDMKDKMPELFSLPVYDAKGMIESWKKMKRTQLEGKYIFNWASDSIADVNKLVEKSQLMDYMNALLRVGQQPDGSYMIDVKKLLDHINGLYNGPKDMVLDESKYYAKISKDQTEKTQIAINVQNMQAEAQAEQQEQMAAAQQGVAAINEQSAQAGGQQNYDALMSKMFG